MSTILQEVVEPVRLAGTNRFELLLFRLGTLASGARELYGINVFKVREALFMPRLTPMPGGPKHVLGVANIRGQIVPVVDLPALVGGRARRLKYLLVTEFQRSVQGFAVEDVEEIVRLDWGQVLPAEADAFGGSITSLARLDAGEGTSRLALVLDSEKVLGDVLGRSAGEISASGLGSALSLPEGRVILIADDSAMARSLIEKVMQTLQVPYVVTRTGKEAWARILALAQAARDEGRPASDRIALILTDLEMPEMDGFTLTRMVKEDDALKGIPVIVHSSLTGKASEEHARKLGAEGYVGKFAAEELAAAVRKAVDPSPAQPQVATAA